MKESAVVCQLALPESAWKQDLLALYFTSALINTTLIAPVPQETLLKVDVS
jgi:hypothetical protein